MIHKTVKFLIVLFIFPAGALQAAGGEFDLEEVLEHHLMDSVIIEWNVGGVKVRPGDPEFENDPYRRYLFRDEEGVYKWQGGLPMHITKRVAMMGVGSILLLFVFIGGARRIVNNPYRVSSMYANIVESLVGMVRKAIVHPNMHGTGPGLEGYILTAFFFILFANLLGLFPPVSEMIYMTQNYLAGKEFYPEKEPGETYSSIFLLWPAITATGDIAVTLPLAAMTTLLVWFTGFKHQGYKFAWQVVPDGVPAWLYPIMWPIEMLVGPISKGFALTIRLLANMTAGHIILVVFIGFIFQAAGWVTYLVVPASVLGSTAIFFLEILVGFLQAFIFTMLSAIFIGSMTHRH